jgi:hypothetical protein
LHVVLPKVFLLRGPSAKKKAPNNKEGANAPGFAFVAEKRFRILYHSNQLDGIHHLSNSTGAGSFIKDHFFLILYMKCHDHECLCLCNKQRRYYKALQDYTYQLSL